MFCQVITSAAGYSCSTCFPVILSSPAFGHLISLAPGAHCTELHPCTQPPRRGRQVRTRNRNVGVSLQTYVHAGSVQNILLVRRPREMTKVRGKTVITAGPSKYMNADHAVAIQMPVQTQHSFLMSACAREDAIEGENTSTM